MDYKPSSCRYEKMEYKPSGKSGLKLPLLSLGLWYNFGTHGNFEEMRKMCFAAFDNGITHFDLANNYGPIAGSAEANFGKILNSDFKGYRDEIIVSTKAGYDMWEGPCGDGGSRKYLLSSLDQSLKRLGVDYVDIFYHHRYDEETPLEESMLALDYAVRSGKALYAGISNYDAEQMIRAMDILKSLNCPFIINQVDYSMLNRWIEGDVKESAAENGVGLIVFSPLSQGVLSDKYLNGIPEGSRKGKGAEWMYDITPDLVAKLNDLNEMAKSRGQSLAQMALSWVLRDGDVTSVLIGASSAEQIIENIGIVGKTCFTKEELDKIDTITQSLTATSENPS